MTGTFGNARGVDFRACPQPACRKRRDAAESSAASARTPAGVGRSRGGTGSSLACPTRPDRAATAKERPRQRRGLRGEWAKRKESLEAEAHRDREVARRLIAARGRNGGGGGRLAEERALLVVGPHRLAGGQSRSLWAFDRRRGREGVEGGERRRVVGIG